MQLSLTSSYDPLPAHACIESRTYLFSPLPKKPEDRKKQASRKGNKPQKGEKNSQSNRALDEDNEIAWGVISLLLVVLSLPFSDAAEP